MQIFFLKIWVRQLKPSLGALASLIIKERIGTDDRETVEQIKENPYLQYFIGLSSYSNEQPFDPSMLSHFRKRIKDDVINKVNQAMIAKSEENSLSELEKKTTRQLNQSINQQIKDN